MSKKKQVLVEDSMTHGWLICIIVSLIVVGFLLLVSSPPALPATERWQEEWECTQWQETGELTNCKEERIIEMWTPGASGIEYPRVAGTEIVCDRETRCTAQTKTRCLITRKSCRDFATTADAPEECWDNDLLVGGRKSYNFNRVLEEETRECDEANTK